MQFTILRSDRKEVVKMVEKKKISQEELEKMNVKSWPIWECEPSTFDWEYDEDERCYFLEGSVTVKTPEGEINIEAGDFVKFPKGLKCVWQVHEKVRKHYKLG